MSKFAINDYLTDTEKKLLDNHEKKEPEDKGRGEIQITSLKDKPASELLVESLIVALKNDDSGFTELDKDKEGIFSQVRIIAKEDINDSPTEAAKFARGADVLIIPNDGFRTMEEEFFINNSEMESKEVFNSVESFLKAKRGVVKAEINAVALEDSCGLGLKNQDTHNEPMSENKGFRLGDNVTYGGRNFTIKYLDQYVALIHACDHEGAGLPVDYHVVRYNDILKAGTPE